MSVRWTRTAQIRPARFSEALAWSKEMAAHVEKKYHLPKVNVWINAFGPVGTIQYSIDYPDLAAVEKALNSVMSDPEYFKMIEKASELFIEGHTTDSVIKQI